MLTPAAALRLVAAPMAAADVGALLDTLRGGGLDADQGAAVLVAWTRRGETAGELAAVVRWLLEHAVALDLPRPAMDLCGTGGSGLTRFNVSTTAAFVLAAGGVRVAKHGNKGSRRADGSFDLLDALGIPYQLPPAALAGLLETTGICFVFARAFHPVVAAMAPARRAAAALGAARTVFNLAGPLANPARPGRQLIGVSDQAVAEVVAGACRELGREHVAVVRGHPGIDEVSITGPTHVLELVRGHLRHRIIDRHHQHGLAHADLPGGEAAVNAGLFAELVGGRLRGPLLDMVVANAAAAFDVWEGRPLEAHSPNHERALALIASGAVAQVVERHRAAARAAAG